MKSLTSFILIKSFAFSGDTEDGEISFPDLSKCLNSLIKVRTDLSPLYQV